MGKKNKYTTKTIARKFKHLPLKRSLLIAEQSINKVHGVKASNKAYIYKSELSYLGKYILDYPNTETGGQLFGYWTASGSPVVVFAIGPGPRANHQIAFFNQDVQYLERVGHILVSHFGLMHIGEWHSHHTLGLDKPSGHDAHTMQKSIDWLHLNRFLLCIGNCRGNHYSIKPYIFIENSSEYSNAEWEIKGDISPYRSQIDSYLTKMNFTSRQYGSEQQSWFDEKNNRIQLKNMMDHMRSLPYCIDSQAQLFGNTVELTTTFSDRIEVISFPSNFPKEPISIRIKYHNNTEPVIKSMSDKYNTSGCSCGNLFEAFIKQYNTLTHDNT